MQSDNKLIDDLVKMVNAAAGTLAGMGREAEASFREKAKEFVGGADFVSREEFEAVKAMAAKARAEQEALAAKVAELEARLAVSGNGAPAAPLNRDAGSSPGSA